MWFQSKTRTGSNKYSRRQRSKNSSTDGTVFVIIVPITSESNSSSRVTKPKTSSKPYSPDRNRRSFEETYWPSRPKSVTSYEQNLYKSKKKDDTYWENRWDQLINQAKYLGIKE